MFLSHPERQLRLASRRRVAVGLTKADGMPARGPSAGRRRFKPPTNYYMKCHIGALPNPKMITDGISSFVANIRTRLRKKTHLRKSARSAGNNSAGNNSAGSVLPYLVHQIFLRRDPKLLPKCSNEMAGVGVADLIGHFIYLVFCRIQQHTGMIEPVLQQVAKNGITVDFLETYF